MIVTIATNIIVKRMYAYYKNKYDKSKLGWNSKEYAKMTKYRDWEYNEVVYVLLWVTLILGVFSLLPISVIAIKSGVDTSQEKAYTVYNAQYEILEYRIQNEDNPLANVDLYNEVIEYNNNVIRSQKNCENPFVNIFYDKSVKKCKVIDVTVFKGKSNEQANKNETTS